MICGEAIRVFISRLNTDIMHILFLIHSLSSGGAERVTAILANYWAENGHQVTIVTITGRERDFYELDSRIKRITLALDHESSVFLQAIVNNLRRIISIRRILKREHPDVVLSMMTTANIISSLAGLGLGIPVIGSERIHPPRFPLSRSWEILRRWSYQGLSALVAQTGQSADWLRCYAPAPKIAVIPNPVKYPLVSHLPYISPQLVCEKMNVQYALLSVGRLDKQKGFDRLVSAFAKLAEDWPQWGLVILGEGELRGMLEHRIKDMGLADRVFLPGSVGNVADWYRKADLYVTTSLFEGFPNALLEALAYGLPAVAVDCETGPRDILRHKTDGLLVPQDDEDELGKALECLMKSKELRSQFSKKAVDVRQRFSIYKVAGMWETLFRETMK